MSSSSSSSVKNSSNNGSSKNGLKMKIKRKDGTRTSHVKHEVVMNENGCENNSNVPILPIGALSDHPVTPIKSDGSGHGMKQIKLNVGKKKGNNSPVTSEYILDTAPPFMSTSVAPSSNVINAPLINTSSSSASLISNGSNNHLHPTEPSSISSISSPSTSPKGSPISKTRSIGTSTSEGTITEPECLGPCEPGTAVTLEGIVWQETEGGLLVVNVTWREKSYVGTLLDCTKHDWAPPPPDSPCDETENIKTSRGIRGKRGREVSNIETRGGGSSKFRGRGKGKSPFTIPASPIEKKKGGMHRSNSEPTTESVNSSPVNEVNHSPVKRRKRDDGLIECPEPNCNKKYKHINGLKYHQAHAHQDDEKIVNSNVNETEEEEPVPASTPSDTTAVPDAETDQMVDEMTDEGIMDTNEEGETRSRSPSPVYSDISDDEPDNNSNHNQDTSSTNESRNDSGSDKKSTTAATSFQPLFSPLTGGSVPFGQHDANSRSQDSSNSDSSSLSNQNQLKPDPNNMIGLRYPYSYSIAGTQVFATGPQDVTTISPVLIDGSSLTPKSESKSDGMKMDPDAKVSPDQKMKKSSDDGMDPNQPLPPSTTSYFLHPSFLHHPSAGPQVLMATAGHPFDPLSFRGPMVGPSPIFLPPHLSHKSPGSSVPVTMSMSPGSVPVIVPENGSSKKGGDNVSSPNSNELGSKNVSERTSGPRDSPPFQRHLHTHHHTHVGVGYPLPVAYDPFGVMASSQQAAAVINPFVATPKT